MSSQRTRRTPLRTRIVAILALASLAAASLTPLVSTEWAAWSHDHGHLTASGVVMPHTHPWEQNPRTTAPADTEGRGDQAIVFTANGDSVPGLTALWIAPLAVVSMAILTCLVALAAAGRPATFASIPASPPPRRGLLTV